jgi:hypothetical protein
MHFFVFVGCESLFVGDAEVAGRQALIMLQYLLCAIQTLKGSERHMLYDAGGNAS